MTMLTTPEKIEAFAEEIAKIQDYVEELIDVPFGHAENFPALAEFEANLITPIAESFLGRGDGDEGELGSVCQAFMDIFTEGREPTRAEQMQIEKSYRLMFAALMDAKEQIVNYVATKKQMSS